jgi:hypothetical protein
LWRLSNALTCLPVAPALKQPRRSYPPVYPRRSCPCPHTSCFTYMDGRFPPDRVTHPQLRPPRNSPTWRKTERGRVLHSGGMDLAEQTAEDRSWDLALSLVAAWRAAADGERAQSAVARRLAEAAAEVGQAAAEQAVLGLTTLGNMFIELYADCAGSSVDSVLREAAALRWDDGPTS